MPDTKLLEYVALHLIAHTLLREKLLVALPSFDRDGVDLLILANVGEGAKFCRAQSKYRSLINKTSSHVAIPKHYVSPNLIVFLFVDDGEPTTDRLYCFFENEVNKWKNGKDEYQLTFSKSKFLKDLEPFKVSQDRINLIRQILEKIDTKQELRDFISPVPSNQQTGDLIHEDDAERVQVQRNAFGATTTITDKTTRTESAGPPCPDDPSMYEFNPVTQVWTAK